MWLHLVIGASFVLAVISMARIFGHLWFYLMLWSWAITGFMLFAIVWTAIEVARRSCIGPDARGPHAEGCISWQPRSSSCRAWRWPSMLRDVDRPAPGLSSVLGAVMPPTEQALLDHCRTATGRDGRYSVTWSDALYIGSQGYGIVLELERQWLHRWRSVIRPRCR